MRKPLLLVALSFFAVTGMAAPKKAKAPDPHLLAGTRALNILQSAKWAKLFNGKDLKGWEGDTEGYIVKDGVLVCQKGAKVLQTVKDYSDFAFSFEFKLEESGNNGIGIRVPDGGRPSQDGMEIQILDHNGSKYQGEAEISGKVRKVSWLKPWQYHGSVYGIHPAHTGYLKPVGEWNQETIVAIDDHVLVILNGAVIVDVFLNEVTPVDGKDHPGMRNKRGRIMFAGHSDHVESSQTGDQVRQHPAGRIHRALQRQGSDRLEGPGAQQCDQAARTGGRGSGGGAIRGRRADESALEGGGRCADL
jgi:hypothetical protein